MSQCRSYSLFRKQDQIVAEELNLSIGLDTGYFFAMLFFRRIPLEGVIGQ